MEKNQQRSLAYALSQIIEIEHLSTISGGGQSIAVNWCKRESFKASGTNMRNADVMVDVVVDI